MKKITFNLLRFLSGRARWAQRRLTRTGRFLLGGMLLSAAIGVDTDLILAYQIFALLAAIFGIAFVAQLFLTTKFTATRELPPFVTVGEPFKYRIRVHHQSKSRQSGLFVLDELADPRPNYDQFRRARTGEGQAIGTSALKRWRTLVTRNRIAEAEPQLLADLGPGEEVEVTCELVPLRRGYLEFEAVTVGRPDPLGIFLASSTHASRASLLVLPKRYAIPELELPGTRVYQHGGVALAASKGDTEEFIGLRDYRAGDPLQKIHWKSFARVGRPVVKEYQDEFFERHALVIDTFSAVGEDAVFEEAVAVAASFACTIETQENLLDLMFVGTEAYTFTAGIGQLHTDSMLEILAGVSACDDKPFRELHDAVLERLALLSSCILILLAWDHERRQMIDDLLAHGLPLRVFLVSDRGAEPERPTVPLQVLNTDAIQQGLAGI